MRKREMLSLDFWIIRTSISTFSCIMSNRPTTQSKLNYPSRKNNQNGWIFWDSSKWNQLLGKFGWQKEFGLVDFRKTTAKVLTEKFHQRNHALQGEVKHFAVNSLIVIVRNLFFEGDWKNKRTKFCAKKFLVWNFDLGFRVYKKI